MKQGMLAHKVPFPIKYDGAYFLNLAPNYKDENNSKALYYKTPDDIWPQLRLLDLSWIKSDYDFFMI
jgi:hypothetical protein